MPFYFYGRGPSRAAIVSDLEAFFQDLGIDPYEIGALAHDENGELEASRGLSILGAGLWNHEKEPTPDYALVNICVTREDIAGQLQAMDKAPDELHPEDVESDVKLPSGTHLITEPTTKTRKFA